MGAGYFTGSVRLSADLLLWMRQKMQDHGWTEFYNSGLAQPDFIMQSPEVYDDTGAHVYVRLKAGTTPTQTASFWVGVSTDCQGSTQILGSGGTVGIHATNQFSPPVSAGNLPYSFWMRVNDKAIGFAIATAAATASFYKGYAGLLRRMKDPTRAGVTRTTAPLTHGFTEIPVAHDLRGRLPVGERAVIINNAGNSSSANSHSVGGFLVTAVSASVIYVSGSVSGGVSGSFDTGAIVGQDPLPACNGGPATAAEQICDPNYCYTHDGWRGVNDLQHGGNATYASTGDSLNDPSADGLVGVGPFCGDSSTLNRQGRRGTFYHWMAMSRISGLPSCSIGTDSDGNYWQSFNNAGSTVSPILGPFQSGTIEGAPFFRTPSFILQSNPYLASFDEEWPSSTQTGSLEPITAVVETTSSVRVYWSTAVVGDTAVTNTAYYGLTGSWAIPILSASLAPGNRSVLLRVSGSLSPSVTYTLDVASGFAVPVSDSDVLNTGGQFTFSGIRDVIPPIVTNLNPSTGSLITSSTPVSFSVTDDQGNFSGILIVAKFPSLGIQEVVHDGSNFGLKYQGDGNSRVPAVNGYTYTVIRDGGWPSSPSIIPYAVDADGNVNS